MSRITLFVLAATVPVFLSACLFTEESGSPESGSRNGMTVENNESDLSDRVTDRDEEILVEDSTGTLSRAAAKNFTLTLIAEIAPPVVNGDTLQATSVHLKGGFAYVSYNLQGEGYGGGVDVIQIRSGRNAVIRSSATYEDADVHALYYDGDLFLATASSSPDFESPAILERMREDGGKLVLDARKRVALESFAATSAYATGNTVYATTGNTGGVSALSASDLEPQVHRSLADARWVDSDGTTLVVAQGTPGRISVYDRASMTLQNTWNFTGANIPESKTTVRVLGGKALIAAGTGGLQLIRLANGNVLGSVPPPVVPGLDSTLTVANAADAEGDLIYVSNGEAGVYAIRASRDLEDDTGNSGIGLTVLGKVRFDDLQSVNHVAFDGNTLVVAAGRGGVKIVSVQGR